MQRKWCKLPWMELTQTYHDLDHAPFHVSCVRQSQPDGAELSTLLRVSPSFVRATGGSGGVCVTSWEVHFPIGLLCLSIRQCWPHVRWKSRTKAYFWVWWRRMGGRAEWSIQMMSCFARDVCVFFLCETLWRVSCFCITNWLKREVDVEMFYWVTYLVEFVSIIACQLWTDFTILVGKHFGIVWKFIEHKGILFQ